MKTQIQLVALALLLVTINTPLSTALAQGSLMPPGAPAPTMKSLDQVEARTPISGATNITQSGSYYLTTNISVSSGDAITIAAGGVTLDLNGFTISSTASPAAGTAISINGVRNVTVVNGFIQGGVTNNGSGTYSGSGFGYGIYYSGGASLNVRVSGVSVSGCQYYGIRLANNSSLVEPCTVRTVGSYGIYASTVRNSEALDCGGTAIFGREVSGCRGETTVAGDGISAYAAYNCYGYSPSGDGITANTVENSTGVSGGSEPGISAYNVHNCFGSSLNGAGVDADTAQNCRGYSYSGAGVNAHTAQNCWGHSTTSGYGVFGNRTAQNCYGESTGGIAVKAATAQNCFGMSSTLNGVSATTVLNCEGTSSTGTGVSGNILQNCRGYSYSNTGLNGSLAIGCYGASDLGTGLSATIANSCRGETESGTAESITYKYNMP